MTNRAAILVTITILTTTAARAQDWPQWRGPQRDARADFKAPKSWPKELNQKWKTTVGEGVATPALVGDKVYVFSREDGNEVLRCLNAADGKEVWQDKYESLGATGPAGQFSGPRSSPAVADGKVVTIGVRGMISCVDAGTGKKLWRKDDFKAWPGFFPSSSPIIVDNLCVAQLGGRENGALVAYDLATGDEKWKWSGPSPAYASPVLMNIGGRKMIVAQTESKLVAINATDGKLAWESASGGSPGGGPGGGGPGGGGMRGGGMGGRYKAATPIVDGEAIIAAGAGIRAVKIAKEGDKITGKELWSNSEKSVQFNTPVLKDGVLYGLSANNELFAINAKDGTAAWSAPFPGGSSGGRPSGGAPGGGPGGPGGGRGGRGGGGGGFGSVVDAGSVLMALTPGAQLVVFAPSETEFKQLATYKVSDNQTHAYPVASGKRLIIKDRDSVALWTVE